MAFISVTVVLLCGLGCRESPRAAGSSPSAGSGQSAPPTVSGAPQSQALVPLQALLGSLARLPGDFTAWDQGPWEFTGDAQLLRAFDDHGDSAVVRLVECLDRSEPARATAKGKSVPVGVMCYWALRRLAYFEWHEDPAYADGWPGEIEPTASLEALRAAKQAWAAVVREKRYRLT